MKRLIYNTLLKLSGLSPKQTDTEKAFEALRTLEAMETYAQQNNLWNSCKPLSRKIIKTFKIQTHAKLWAVLEEINSLKNHKNDNV